MVLQQELAGIDAVRAKPWRYLPAVSTPEAVHLVIAQLYRVDPLFIQLLYGSGLRLSEGCQLLVKDLDFAHYQLLIRDTQGREA